MMKAEGESVKFMQSVIDIGTLIVHTPGICGGRPRIASTRVSVQRIAAWYKMGLNAEEIVERMGNLTLAQVYAALTYYHANREEIEVYLSAEKADYERLAAEMGQLA
jgi:uncharacterized protein (DUF433 family)